MNLLVEGGLLKSKVHQSKASVYEKMGEEFVEENVINLSSATVQNDLEFDSIMKGHQKNSVEGNSESLLGKKARQRSQKQYSNYKDSKKSIFVLKKTQNTKKPPPPGPGSSLYLSPAASAPIQPSTQTQTQPPKLNPKTPQFPTPTH